LIFSQRQTNTTFDGQSLRLSILFDPHDFAWQSDLQKAPWRFAFAIVIFNERSLADAEDSITSSPSVYAGFREFITSRDLQETRNGRREDSY